MRIVRLPFEPAAKRVSSASIASGIYRPEGADMTETITRIVNATPERVWELWTTPTGIEQDRGTLVQMSMEPLHDPV
jgi:hypothetical protein